MKPRWYFAAGSLLLLAGLVGLSLLAIFLTNLTFWLLRSHGPMGQWRLELMLDSFPWWVPLLAVGGIVLGIRLLKQYDFSYRKNFIFIILGFILAVILTAYIVDGLGFNEDWSKRGPMRRFYQQMEPGWGGRLRD